MNKMLLLVSCLATALLSLPVLRTAWADIPEFDHAGNPLSCDVHGRFDSGWGYRVLVPDGLVGCQPDPHTLLIPLGARTDNRTINVGGGYNAVPYATVKEEVDDFVTSLSSDPHYEHARVLKRDTLALGGQRAERVVVRYEEPHSHNDMILELVTVLSSIINEGLRAPRYDYSISLETPKPYYRQDRKVLVMLLNSWQKGVANL